MHLAQLVLVCVLSLCFGSERKYNNWRFPYRRIKERLTLRERHTVRVCYDVVGCFDIIHARSPLQKLPESPKVLDTKFYILNRRDNVSIPDPISYEDNGESLHKSNFNASLPLKVFVHGYMSSWNGRAMQAAANTMFQVDNQNVVLMDWEKGARGPHYSNAAANTELAGRQLGILLFQMIKQGLNPNNVHLIGFSLGAHVSGCASEYLKRKGLLIGRITGLDPASPLFRQSTFREKSKKLDKEDAIFVDVLHSDSSPSVTDGFGLWEPIGHVDFFPNGGQEQPGCHDIKPSILLSQIEGLLTEGAACSHIRAFRYFLETLLNKLNNNDCQFYAYKCAGGVQAFQEGQCFPYIDKSIGFDEKYRTDLGVFGINSRGNGVMYFATKNTEPFCGKQLQLSLHIMPKKFPCDGIIQFKLHQNNETTYFRKEFDIESEIQAELLLQGIIVVDHHDFDAQKPSLIADLQFTIKNTEESNQQNSTSNVLYVHKINLRDMYGNSWHTCSSNTILKNLSGNFEENKNTVVLYQKKC